MVQVRTAEPVEPATLRSALARGRLERAGDPELWLRPGVRDPCEARRSGRPRRQTDAAKSAIRERSIASSAPERTRSCAARRSGRRSAASCDRKRLSRPAEFRRDADLSRVPIRVALWSGGGARDGARRARDVRVHPLSRPRSESRRGRGRAHGAWLLVERHDRHLRSRAGEPAATAEAPIDRCAERSINETLPRTILTGGTTLATALVCRSSPAKSSSRLRWS